MSDADDRETSEGGLARRTVMKAAAVVGTVGGGLDALVAPGRAHEDDELENTITVRATGEVARYKFSVSGAVELTANAGGGEDVISGNTVTGKVAGYGEDTFRFSGHVTAFEFLEGDAEVLVNGEVVDHLPPKRPHTITFTAQGERVNYEFAVNGDVALTDDAGGGEDVIEGNTATGTVAGHSSDTFRFSGHVEHVARDDGPLEVTIQFDGE